MNGLSYESNHNLARTKTDKKTKRWVRLLAGLLIALIWLLIAYGGFTLARHYIDGIQRQLDQMAETNAAEVLALSTQLTALQTSLDEHKANAEALQAQFIQVEDELIAVKEEMSLAGDSLSTTAETKQALSERITDLSKELSELRKLIQRLEEAARVY